MADDTPHTHGSPAETLDMIREGGTALVTIAFARLEEIRSALEEGNFTRAQEITGELGEKLRGLSFAQSNIAAFKDTFLVRADDLEEGMLLSGWGRIIGLERAERDCAVPGQKHVYVNVKFEDGNEQALDGRVELLGVRE